MTHSWHDIVFIDRLYKDLCAHGLDGFLDKYAIKPGDKIAKEIQTGLEACEVYLPVLSHAALKSDWCDEEIHAALTLHNTPGRNHRPLIIPILIEDCRIALQTYPFLLTRLYIDFAQDYDTELGRLLSALGVVPEPKSTTPTLVAPSQSNSQPAIPKRNKQPVSSRRTNPKQVTRPMPSRRTQIDLDHTYLDALDAVHSERFDQAAEKFRAIIAIDPNYEDVATKLAEVEQRLHIADLRARGTAAMDAKNWNQAVQCWQELLLLVPKDPDAPLQLAAAQRRMQLPESYKLALKAIDAQQWQVARTSLEEIARVDPNYRELQRLMVQVVAELRNSVPRTRFGSDGKEMLPIPAGEFVMGASGVKNAPPHKVHLDEFYISRYPVTNSEYKKFVDATKHAPPAHWSIGQIPAGKENHPVVNVTWFDAIVFAQWAGARLPTEAEWEKAASWDDAKKVKRVFPWGETFDANKFNVRESGINDTSAVGRYSPQGDSFYGVGDMAGNIWEWCADRYDPNYYKNSPARNPRGPTFGQTHVLRGGSWNLESSYARTASRQGAYPNDGSENIGFRIVVDVS